MSQRSSSPPGVPRLGRLIGWLALLLVACNLTALPPATPSPAPASTPGAGRLVVAWVDAGNLMVWRSGEQAPRRIASGGVVQPYLSPDGRYVAFTRGPQGNALALWLADVEGLTERELVGPDDLAPSGDAQGYARHVGQVGWLDGQTVLFNTRFVPQVPAPGGGKADDLWRGSALTHTASRLLPDGQGGDFAISPDGAWVALVTPGHYQAAQGLIRLTDAQGQAVTDMLRFDAVGTASEYAFYPRPHWLPSSTALLVAIPHPDLVYATQPGQASRSVALWRLGIGGGAIQSGAVPASFFGLPRWSPDGEWMTYLETVGEPADNTLALVLARGDGSQPTQLLTAPVGALEPPQWSAAGYFYTYGAPGEAWLGRPGLAAARFPGEGEPVFALAWADAVTALYASAPGSPYELRLYDLEAASLAAIATVSGGPPAFDARRVP